MARDRARRKKTRGGEDRFVGEPKADKAIDAMLTCGLNDGGSTTTTQPRPPENRGGTGRRGGIGSGGSVTGDGETGRRGIPLADHLARIMVEG